MRHDHFLKSTGCHGHFLNSTGRHNQSLRSTCEIGTPPVKGPKYGGLKVQCLRFPPRISSLLTPYFCAAHPVFLRCSPRISALPTQISALPTQISALLTQISDWSVVIIPTLPFSLTGSRGEYLRVVGIHSDG